MEDIFIGRQPILDKQQKIFGYELLFRDTSKNYAQIKDHDQATATVIAHTLHNLGFNRLVGEKKGFINVDATILSREFIELLPQENTVFEILEHVLVNRELLDWCKYLKTEGYLIALDDFTYSDSYKPLLDIADFIKFDIRAYDKDELIETTTTIKKYLIKLLAEKVETQEEFEFCVQLGFEFFQGYFFAKPTIIQGTKIAPSQLVLFEIFNSLSREDDIDIIEKLFKRQPELDLKLLKLINSASYYLRQTISSLRQAIMLLGYRNLQNWVSLMLFAGDTANIKSNPLVERAAMRGLMMESLTARITGDRRLAESAFLTGILSLTDSLLHLPLQEILSELNISEEISNALCERNGILGRLLILMEKYENEDFIDMEKILDEFRLDMRDFLAIETRALMEFG